GIPDIFWDYAHGSGLHDASGGADLWLGDSYGSFVPVASNLAYGMFDKWLPTIVDLNGDGKADILWSPRRDTDNPRTVVGSSSLAFVYWISNGNGTFRSITGATTATYDGFVPAVGVLHGEGLPD